MTAEARVQPVTVQDALNRARRLSPVSDTAYLDGQLLLAHVLGVDRSWLFAHGEQALPAEASAHYLSLLDRRESGEPVAYILGKQEFWSLEFEVDRHTLIPRPETEHLVEAVLDRLGSRPQLVLADIGTGSGAIAIALAFEKPAWEIIASDVSSGALAVASRNASRLVTANVPFLKTHWLNAFRSGSLDAVVSNPPYIESTDPHLDRLGSEPRRALVAGSDGLDDIRKIVANACRALKSGGMLFLEHGATQQTEVLALLASAGFDSLEGLADLAGRPRLCVGTRP